MPRKKEKSKRQPPRSAEFWEGLVRQYEDSEVTQDKFAETHSVNVWTFRTWLYKTRKKESESQSAPTSASPNLSDNQSQDRPAANTQEDLEQKSTPLAPKKDTEGPQDGNWRPTTSRLKTAVFDLAERNQLLQNRIDELEERLEDILHKTVYKLGDLVEDYLADVVSGKFSLAAEQSYAAAPWLSDIRSMRTVVRTLESHVEDVMYQMGNTPTPPQVVEINKRIEAALESGARLLHQPLEISMHPDQLVGLLREKNFIITSRLAEELLEKIKSRKLLVLKGVPGTGKSQLAKHLADILLADGPEPRYTQFNVFPEATVAHSIGGLRLIEKTFAPDLGWLSEAAISAIEANGRHWLLLDEINRGDISALLAPALDALSPNGVGYIEHPNLFPQLVKQGGRIPLPGSFRIIGTMNPFDEDLLFTWTSAFSRRIGFVHIPPLLDEDEQELLDLMAVRRQMEILGWPQSDIENFKLSQGVDKVLHRITHTVAGIRSLASREPKHLYQQCEVGTALVLGAARQACQKCSDDPARAKTHLDDIADEALCKEVLSLASDYSRHSLRCLRDEVFNETWAKKCRQHLNDILEGKT